MIMAATMDPKPEKLQQNVILKFRNLKVKTITKLYWFRLVALISKDIQCISRQMEEMEERSVACFAVTSATKSKNQFNYCLLCQISFNF